MILVTPGEPAGIGPELVCRYATKNASHGITAVADVELLRQTAAKLGLDLNIHPYGEPSKDSRNHLPVIPVKLASEVKPGKLDKANAAYVLKTLETATDLCMSQQYRALVTGPVQKSIINDAGIAFSGHTEFLCERANCKRVVMMLATEGLRVALATTHLPLRQVADSISAKLLTEVITILHNDLTKQFGIAAPRILVAGLNPHAGENGHLGREELEIITPTLEALNKTHGWNLVGPLPADTLFTPKHLERCDAVLAMYHDQGLPVLKYKGFGQAVNITLGLPFIRTSVDHGTALDLAGKGVADLGSLETAIHYARTMIKAKR